MSVSSKGMQEVPSTNSLRPVADLSDPFPKQTASQEESLGPTRPTARVKLAYASTVLLLSKLALGPLSPARLCVLC